MKYRFINEHRHRYGVAALCRMLEVARSGYYAWVHKPLSDRAVEDQRLLTLIRYSHQASGKIYGSPRIFLDLREVGERCGKHRVARLMRTHQIKAVRGYKTPKHPGGRPSLVAPDKLQRAFTVEQADIAWVTDITYIRTWQGWLYLAIVLDLYSRKVVGWSMKPTLANLKPPHNEAIDCLPNRGKSKTIDGPIP